MRRARTGLVNSIERSGRLETSLSAAPCAYLGAVVLRFRGVLVLLVCVVFLRLGSRRCGDAGARCLRRQAHRDADEGLDRPPDLRGRVHRGDDARGSVADESRNPSPIEARLHLPGPRPAARDLAVPGALDRRDRDPGRLRASHFTGGPACVASIRKVRCALSRANFRGATVRLTTPRAGRARFTMPQGSLRRSVVPQSVSRGAGGHPGASHGPSPRRRAALRGGRLRPRRSALLHPRQHDPGDDDRWRVQRQGDRARPLDAHVHAGRLGDELAAEIEPAVPRLCLVARGGEARRRRATGAAPRGRARRGGRR